MGRAFAYLSAHKYYDDIDMPLENMPLNPANGVEWMLLHLAYQFLIDTSEIQSFRYTKLKNAIIHVIYIKRD